MVKSLKQYKPSALLAAFCGIVTMLLGIVAAAAYRIQIVSCVAIGSTMVINCALHLESYLVNKRNGSRQPNVLTMVIAEGISLLFMSSCFGDWKGLMILFSFYLVFNGASLMAIPSKFAVYCGGVAILMGVLLYFFGCSWCTWAALLVGINLLVNGAERVIMSLMGGKQNTLGDDTDENMPNTFT